MAAKPKKLSKTGRPMGRPSLYTPDIVDRICAELAQGRSLRSICAASDMPVISAVQRWLTEHEDFKERYASARRDGLDAMAEEAISIADDGQNDTYLDDDGNRRTDYDVVQRSKLRVDTRKWFLSKLAPGRYGDKQDINITGTLQTMSQEQLDARLTELLRKAGISGPAVGELPPPSEE